MGEPWGPIGAVPVAEQGHRLGLEEGEEGENGQLVGLKRVKDEFEMAGNGMALRVIALFPIEDLQMRQVSIGPLNMEKQLSTCLVWCFFGTLIESLGE